ncbi:hypothetical protein RKD55_001714 [Rossellomorea marisflavi]
MPSPYACRLRTSPLRFSIVQLRGLEARGHKSKSPKRQRTPFWCLRLMLVASGRAPSAFLLSSSGGLRLEVISRRIQKGKGRLSGFSVLCLSPQSTRLRFSIVQLRGLEARGHKSKSPKRQRTPFWCLRLMLVASGRAPSAFLYVQLRRLEARGHKSKSPKRQRTPFRCLCLMLVASGRAPSAFLSIFLLYNGRLMGRVFLE